MTDNDIELISQYLDGELSVAATEALEERLAAEPELAANLEQMRNINRSLSESFRHPQCSEVPQRTRELLESAAPARVIPFPVRKRRRNLGFAVAASLVATCGLVITQTWQDAGNSPSAHDLLLSRALEQTQSGAEQWQPLDDGRHFKAVLSFPHMGGSWCREYLMSSSDTHSRGIACRTEGRWITHVSVAEHGIEGSGNEYRPAGAASPRTIEGFITDYAGDIPLDANREAELIAEGWE